MPRDPEALAKYMEKETGAGPPPVRDKANTVEVECPECGKKFSVETKRDDDGDKKPSPFGDKPPA